MAKHGAYVVRDVGENTNPDDLYPYTLHGLIAAIEDARLRSSGESPPQELIVIPAKGPRRVVRRYERGREVPVPLLCAISSGCQGKRGLPVLIDTSRALFSGHYS